MHGWGWGGCFGCSRNITNDNDDVPHVMQAGINGLHGTPVPGCAWRQCRDTHIKDSWENGSYIYTLTLCLGKLFIHMASLNPCSRPRKGGFIIPILQMRRQRLRESE